MTVRRSWVAMLVPVAFGCSLKGLADGAPDASLGGSGGTSGIGGIGATGGSICDAGECVDGSAGSAGSSSCASGTRDGSETDVDCGGDCPKCLLDRICKQDSDCRTNVCAEGKCACPADMTYVPTPIAEGVPYCVDQNEITNEQYDLFLKLNPNPSDQPAVCVWNTEFEPSSFASNLKSKPKHPVVSVDWCDARAYCWTASKRLCGKLGGGEHLFTLPQSATNEWYVACSQAGKNLYVYGNTFDPAACAVKEASDAATGTTSEIGSFPGCEGGYEKIFDMNGNVWEWEDSCNDVDGGDAAATLCRRRGGGADDTQFCGRCTTCGSAQRARNNPSSMTGFRCCSG